MRPEAFEALEVAGVHAHPDDVHLGVKTMQPTDFLDHAQELAQDGRPAWCRSAVSRAYYAAHHAAVDCLYRVEVRTPADGAAHVAAYNALVSIEDDDAVSGAGGDLMTLHGKRNIA